MKKIIMLTMLLMMLPATFGAFGDLVTTHDITPNTVAGQGEAWFPIGNEWHAVTGGDQDQYLTKYDSNFNLINGTRLEHFDEPAPSFLFNTDGTYNGTHYFVLRRNLGAQVYVYDSGFNYVQNITASVGINSVHWNGSSFLGAAGKLLYDMGSNLQASTLLTSNLEVDVNTGGISKVGEILYVAEQNNAGSNVTAYNTSNNYSKLPIKHTVSGTFITALGANASNVIIYTGNIDNELLDSGLNVVDANIAHETAIGSADQRSLTFDGTNWWILDRAADTWWKYDSAFNPISKFSIISNGSNWRSGTVIGSNLYAWEEDSDMIHVWTTQGVWNFSFDPAPFRNTAGNIRGLNSNESHLFVNNHLGVESPSDVGIFEVDGTYTGVNITLQLPSVGDRYITFPDFDTVSTDIVGSCGDINDNWAFLCRWDKTGINTAAINMSTIIVNSSFPYGLEYLPSTNEIYILTRFAGGDPAFSNPNEVAVVDGGSLNIMQTEDLNQTIGFNLFLNGTESNIVIADTETFNVYYLTNVTGFGILQRNGTPILNNSVQDLAEGAYNFTIVHEFNTSAPRTAVTRTATVLLTTPVTPPGEFDEEVSTLQRAASALLILFIFIAVFMFAIGTLFVKSSTRGGK